MEQRPLDDEAGTRMSALRSAADAVIARLITERASGRPAEACYRDGVTAIAAAMPAVFGPANAWLFNERDKKLDALQTALELPDPAWCHAVREELLAPPESAS